MKSFRICSPLLASAFAVTLAMPASGAIVITTEDGALGADNQVIPEQFLDLNKGLASNFELRRRSGFGGGNFIGVLRFDLSSLTPTDIADIQTVTLNISFQEDELTGAGLIDVYAVNDGYAGGSPDPTPGLGTLDELGELSYTEGNDNFNTGTNPELMADNAPAFIESAAAATGSYIDTTRASLLGTLAYGENPTAGTTLSFSSTSLASAVQGDSNDAIVLYLLKQNDVSSEVLSFYTKEGTSDRALQPNLSIVVPEPGTLALAAVGGSLCMIRRRG